MNTFRKIMPLCLLIILISCSSEEQNTTANIEGLPSPVTLIFPVNNTECNEGIIVSDTQTDVLFKWEEAENTSSYILILTNLNNGTSREIKTVANEFLIRILRGTPYSWVVKSKASIGNATADSETWRFYNAGLPIESHPPFPAEVVSPKMGASVDEGTVLLQWGATDVDNDIASYTILLDTSSTPTTEVGNPSTNSLNITVSSGQVYYWKVITNDELGNESHSQIFQFRVK
ncbi:fibronectin type III domain-containing protein [Siansivirga zeaxanthinifaciens]|uniref:Fibronectin type-III domain-containing protein n=1 Tax=Siansivirga zeaxanthinifaciens CC-SAMT-1 TaxID=1454006 RepID=A0A0C5WAA0_9FLAO|nr:hypothetical protein [Siansivirga zeaxanthinifaciens]AJR03227.1 hypothetical protein AW14_05770 [Siansivirga zeaxanthinifaciens CC-SAMT-1]